MIDTVLLFLVGIAALNLLGLGLLFATAVLYEMQDRRDARRLPRLNYHDFYDQGDDEELRSYAGLFDAELAVLLGEDDPVERRAKLEVLEGGRDSAA